MVDPSRARIAYFSMEIALENSIPTYAGGLGVLAGDMLRSAADGGVPMVGLTLAYRKGYFEQTLSEDGQQIESPSAWDPAYLTERMEATAHVMIEGRTVKVAAWRYEVAGLGTESVPVFLLDTALAENEPQDREWTDRLYGGDRRYRLCQEMILGMGGVRMLRALGYDNLESYHMNEGHSAFLTVALMEEQLRACGKSTQGFDGDMSELREKCVFTTHTPVPAGHDVFDRGLLTQVMGQERASGLAAAGLMLSGQLNMTELALYSSRYVNGVAMRHGEVSRIMFPRFSIRAITNGVHAATWTSQPFQDLYDRLVPEWRTDNNYLRYAKGMPLEEIQQAHAAAKHTLFETIARETGVALDESALTLGFARRAAVYKRADLLLSDPEKLQALTKSAGPLQIIYAGKAHPADEEGKAVIRRVFSNGAQLRNGVRLIYIANYDMRWGGLLTSGVDLWVNTPLRPYEASGTSGMKAALNGVPSLSVLDGWWVEGHAEGVTGWSIGDDAPRDGTQSEASLLYDKLENVIMPQFYTKPLVYAEVMRGAIAFNGSFFNTQRMLRQYVRNAYRFHELEPGEPEEVGFVRKAS
ncbi:MAG TPA: alpha-glucan family phosphorylase [Terriglobia bacterium]|nr:alpha-glucan family phosphorylase [Terriglobia bacterium]